MVVDALFKRYSLLTMLETKFLGFNHMKEIYLVDKYFRKTYELYANLANGGLYIHDGFLFKEKRLCAQKKLLVKETREGGSMGHFGEYKTFKILQEYFFWSNMKRYVHHICNRCLSCKSNKAKVNLHGLYTPLTIPTIPWTFVLDLPRSKNGRDSIFIVVIRFFRMTYFIPCHKVDDVCIMVNLFFKEVARFYGLPKTIVPNRYSKFLDHFWRTLWSKLDTKLLFFTTCHPQMDGQTKVINGTLSQLLRCFIGRILKSWEEWLLHIEFAYNRIVNTITSHSPFEFVYRFNPLSPLDLLSLPNLSFMISCDRFCKAQFVKDLHAKAHSHIEKKVPKYVNKANKGKKQRNF
ncbi:hypothetical protein CR513_00107, partial [Mucuna pruriens]